MKTLLIFLLISSNNLLPQKQFPSIKLNDPLSVWFIPTNIISENKLEIGYYVSNSFISPIKIYSYSLKNNRLNVNYNDYLNINSCINSVNMSYRKYNVQINISGFIPTKVNNQLNTFATSQFIESFHNVVLNERDPFKREHSNAMKGSIFKLNDYNINSFNLTNMSINYIYEFSIYYTTLSSMVGYNFLKNIQCNNQYHLTLKQETITRYGSFLSQLSIIDADTKLNLDKNKYVQYTLGIRKNNIGVIVNGLTSFYQKRDNLFITTFNDYSKKFLTENNETLTIFYVYKNITYSLQEDIKLIYTSNKNRGLKGGNNGQDFGFSIQYNF